ncbi:MAG TPA: TetR-like C-terminal domain-containing protein [Thermotogota bacterium]|nr:TetR-like C-terminal domain-containing protein [Thermotogota bacterium]HPJ88607.1 TetR-like C-terminal domain-containing protein [Thermotogota bacterium]HPR96653.1 TetR-like C-terminal domain-containing protein [Thermotogota bacterium]
MKREKTDRRVKYTKMLLKNGLVELLKDNPISKITVKKLCETADVNRSTFYTHYDNQYDLLNQLIIDVIEEFGQYVSTENFTEGSQTTILMVKKMVEYAAENAELMKSLLRENGYFSFSDMIVMIAQCETVLEIREQHGIDRAISDYMLYFIFSGALSILHKWLLEGMIETPQKIAEIITKLIYNGVSGLYTK